MTPSFRERVKATLIHFSLADRFRENPERNLDEAMTEILSLVRGIIPEKRDLSASYDSYDADYEWNLCREYILNEMGENNDTRKL